MSVPPQPSPHSGSTAPQADASLAEQVAEIASAVAELRATRAAERIAKQGWGKLRPLEITLLVLLGASLLLHALTIGRLFAVRNTLHDQINLLADGVTQAKNDQLTYTLTIDQQLPVNIDVPIKRSLEVPIDTAVRIKQNIDLPVQTALGNFTIPVPIDANIPISTTVPIAFDQTVAINTNVPIKLDVPIRIDLGSEQVAPLLDRLREKLIELSNSL